MIPLYKWVREEKEWKTHWCDTSFSLLKRNVFLFRYFWMSASNLCTCDICCDRLYELLANVANKQMNFILTLFLFLSQCKKQKIVSENELRLIPHHWCVQHISFNCRFDPLLSWNKIFTMTENFSTFFSTIYFTFDHTCNINSWIDNTSLLRMLRKFIAKK